MIFIPIINYIKEVCEKAQPGTIHTQIGNNMQINDQKYQIIVEFFDLLLNKIQQFDKHQQILYFDQFEVITVFMYKRLQTIQRNLNKMELKGLQKDSPQYQTYYIEQQKINDLLLPFFDQLVSKYSDNLEIVSMIVTIYQLLNQNTPKLVMLKQSTLFKVYQSCTHQCQQLLDCTQIQDFKENNYQLKLEDDFQQIKDAAVLYRIYHQITKEQQDEIFYQLKQQVDQDQLIDTNQNKFNCVLLLNLNYECQHISKEELYKIVDQTQTHSSFYVCLLRDDVEDIDINTPAHCYWLFFELIIRNYIRQIDTFEDMIDFLVNIAFKLTQKQINLAIIQEITKKRNWFKKIQFQKFLDTLQPKIGNEINKTDRRAGCIPDIFEFIWCDCKPDRQQQFLDHLLSKNISVKEQVLFNLILNKILKQNGIDDCGKLDNIAIHLISICNTDNYLINNSSILCFTSLIQQHIKWRKHDIYTVLKLSEQNLNFLIQIIKDGKNQLQLLLATEFISLLIVKIPLFSNQNSDILFNEIIKRQQSLNIDGITEYQQQIIDFSFARCLQAFIGHGQQGIEYILKDNGKIIQQLNKYVRKYLIQILIRPYEINRQGRGHSLIYEMEIIKCITQEQYQQLTQYQINDDNIKQAII